MSLLPILLSRMTSLLFNKSTLIRDLLQFMKGLLKRVSWLRKQALGFGLRMLFASTTYSDCLIMDFIAWDEGFLCFPDFLLLHALSSCVA